MVIDKTYTHSDFRGQIFMPAPVTPFAPGGDLMLDAYSEILEWYLGHQADALLIAGNNGEGYALSSDELRQVTETALKTVAGRVPIFVHVSRTSNAESIALARVAADAGAPGICLMGQPFIHAATKAEIVARFEAVAKAVPLPMLAFNSMHYTQFCLTPDILSAIADVAPVCAVKNTVTDFDHITTMIAELGDRFPIMWGGATTLITGLLLGSGGFVGTGVEFFGRDCKDQFLAVHDMTPEERTNLALSFGPVTNAVQRLSPPPSGLKVALNMIGLPAGVPREPVQPATPDVEDAIRDVFRRIGILEEHAVKRA